MDIQHAGIVTMLRNALNNENIPLPEGFAWEGVAKTAREHRLTGLILQGAARCGVPRSHPALTQMTREFCDLVQQGRAQGKRLQQLLERFEQENIAYMPVKGAVIKPLYERPDCRTMGDADIFIRMEQYAAIERILTDMGFRKERESQYEIEWYNPRLKIELHYGAVFPYLKTFYRYYGNGWGLAKKNETGSGFHLSAEDHYVYLLVHFAKHYMLGTICAKDICDFWVWKKTHPDMDEAYIRGEIQKLKLEKFYQNVEKLLVCWFAGRPATDTVERITAAAFSGGTSGDFDEASAKGAVDRYSSREDSLLRKKLKWFFSAVFPGLAIMKPQYPVLKRWPVLLPFCWVHRWVQTVFCRRDRLKRGMIVMTMDERQKEEYQAHMEDVGLDPDA